ncbi:MAG: cyclohexanone monooxygenase [Acidimicrobiales bacterium]|jgi:cyclohexanone monooxygenase
MKEQGGSVVEARQEEMRSKGRIGERFRAECTPGYYNNEGKAGNKLGFFTGTYGAGPIKFFRVLDKWRQEGTLDGVKIS